MATGREFPESLRFEFLFCFLKTFLENDSKLVSFGRDINLNNTRLEKNYSFFFLVLILSVFLNIVSVFHSYSYFLFHFFVRSFFFLYFIHLFLSSFFYAYYLFPIFFLNLSLFRPFFVRFITHFPYLFVASKIKTWALLSQKTYSAKMLTTVEAADIPQLHYINFITK